MSSSGVNTSCDYCGLPLIQPAGRSAERLYCCLGCRFAASVTAEDGQAQQSQWTLARLGFAIFCTMNVMVFTMALWSRDVYGWDASTAGSGASSLSELFRYGCLVFSAPVLLLLGGPLIEQAWSSARRGVVTVDWILGLGVAASYVYSVVSLATDGRHVYFEVGCMVLVAVTLGRWFEATGKLKTTQALQSLQRLLPESARRVRENDMRDVPLAELRVNDVVRVLPGERIPVDSRIVRGRGVVDEQLITGEGMPRIKSVGDALFGGSLNLDGDLLISVTATSWAGTLQRLVDAVTAAAECKGREQRLADKLARFFVPVVATLAVTTWIVHWQHAGFHTGVMSALAIILISCPCALGIATPLSVWAAMGTGAKHQLLFRDGDALSRLARVQTIFFDKTGTLSTGKLCVRKLVTAADADPSISVRAAGGLASGSTHAMAKAIRRYALARHRVAGLLDVATFPGLGVAGVVPELGQRAYLGSPRFLGQHGCRATGAVAEAIVRSDGREPLTCIGWAGEIKGVFVFSDRLRPAARDALRRLREMGMEMAILTGDRTDRASPVGRELGVTVHAELLPQDKLMMIEAARQASGLVAMVGDGINDAPALAGADVGIAMGCGADVTREAADICLLGNDLRRLAWSIDLARRTVRTIRQNLFWACAYNSIGVGLAAAGWLNPILAAIAMVGSSVFVISNSLRLAGETNANSSAGEGRVESMKNGRSRSTEKDGLAVPSDLFGRSGDQPVAAIMSSDAAKLP